MQFDLTAADRGHDGPPVKPSRDGYEEWLAHVWKGDRRELRQGRYLQQQRDLQEAFDRSEYLAALRERLPVWAGEYQAVHGVPMFDGAPPAIKLVPKLWSSFVSRTWRENVHNNDDWPKPPPGGWLAPDCWFEGLWDIVRTRIVVRYLDGVQFLAQRMAELGDELDIDVYVKTHAQESGYYAMHINVRQEFQVQTLNFAEQETRHSRIEIQLTTHLQETIGHLTHGFFERRREEKADPDQKWQWDYKSPEFTPYYLGHLLHYLEGMIMRVREEIKQPDDE